MTALEEIILDPGFQHDVQQFCMDNCGESCCTVCCCSRRSRVLKQQPPESRIPAEIFEPDEENQIQYTTLFTAYTEMLESRILGAVSEAVPGTTEEDIESLLTTKADELVGDVFDALLTMGDFDEFKQLMLSYKDQLRYERGLAAGTGPGSSAVISSSSLAAAGAGSGQQPAYAGLAPTVISLSSPERRKLAGHGVNVDMAEK